MSTLRRVHRMLRARGKGWMAPIALVAIALGRIAMRRAPDEERQAFIYTLF